MLKKNEKLSVNIEDFMKNPFGKGVTAFNNSSVKDSLQSRYNKMVTSGKKVEVHKVYYHKGKYYIHLLIPSESERPNNYDVVVSFEKGGMLSTSQFVTKSKIQLFSNCPSFVYSFAWVYNKRGLLIDAFMNKYDSIVFEKDPEVRNPYEVINYDKSIFFALHYILNNKRYMNIAHLDALSRKTEYTDMLEKVRLCKKIEFEITKETAIIRERKALLKSGEAKSVKKDERKTNASPKVGKITAKSKVKPRKGTVSKVKPRR